jgi:hypothetical protein
MYFHLQPQEMYSLPGATFDKPHKCLAAWCAHFLDRLLRTVDNKCRKYRCNCMYAISKVWFAVCQFSQNSQLRNTLTWRFFVLNFTKVNKEMLEVLTNFFNLLSKV